MSNLKEIESIGEVYSKHLEDAGVGSIDALLEVGGDKAKRKELAEKAKVSEKMLLNWVNRADLSRIKGVSTQYADLLECAGVDTVPELAQRNGVNLLVKMTEVNKEKTLVKKLPTESQVGEWIAQAKALPRAVFY